MSLERFLKTRCGNFHWNSWTSCIELCY